MDRFPAAPAAWYFFGLSRELRRGPVSKEFLGRLIVAYRTDAGRAVVMDARCSHLSADLGCGQVVGDGIRCPFHHWEYGPDGACRRIPAEAVVPSFARQRAYPVEERHELLFFFNGPEPLFPLPFFFDCAPKDFVAGSPFQFSSDLAWYMVAANAFDGQHFQAVHDRRLTHPPDVDRPEEFARRIRFNAEVVGDSIFDRLLRQFVGGVVDISITCWGGPMVLVTGFFRRAESYLLISLNPQGALTTLTSIIVFTQRKPGRPLRRLLEPISLWLRRIFTQGFMQDDRDRLHGVRYNPSALLPSDRLMSDFFDWLAALYREASTFPPPRATPDVEPNVGVVAGHESGNGVSGRQK
jgi:nitrite reductase/ring-hydroxylating ferredoxin subunit